MSGAARFLFATEGGTILGWTPSVNGTAAVVGADRSGVGAVYKGLAIANDRLYATDFHNGRVDVFDSSFKLITTAGGFKDAKIAKGFEPFGIQALGNDFFVTCAKQDSAKHDDVPVPGQAYVDEFAPDGRLVARLVNSGLVGNFGDGSAAGPTNTLYFASGPSNEQHGLFGSITAS